MNKVLMPWTPDDCPLQVGSVIHDFMNNTDLMITVRHCDYNDNDIKNENQFLDLVTLGDGRTLSGNDLMDGRYVWYYNWPSTSDDKRCCKELL